MSPTARKTPRRNRADQMKNVNALKSRLYDPALDDEEFDALDLNPVMSIQDEIGVMRILIRRVMMLAKGIDTLDEAISALGALGSASTQLASLLRSQKALADDPGRTTDTISQALSEVMREFNLR